MHFLMCKPYGTVPITILFLALFTIFRNPSHIFMSPLVAETVTESVFIHISIGITPKAGLNTPIKAKRIIKFPLQWDNYFEDYVYFHL